MVVTDVVVCRIVSGLYTRTFTMVLMCGEGGMSESGVLVQGNLKARPRFASRLHSALPYDHVLLQLETASPAHI